MTQKTGFGKPLVVDEVPPEPADFVGSDAEWRVYWWLTKEKIPFDFQSSRMGGRQILGGLVVDFIVYDRDPGLVINVQGLYFHFGSAGLRAGDLLTKQRLLSMGYDVVYVRESDVNERLGYTMRMALQGVQLFAD